MTAAQDRIPQIIAGEIQAKAQQVIAAVALLDEGATVPFIARYRKEVTGGLDDTQLRTLAERLGYLRELEARRKTIARQHHVAGQADRRAGGQDRRRDDQGGAGRPLSSLQAQAPHPRRDRPRARPAAAGRCHPGRPHASIRPKLAAGLSQRRGAGRQGGARRRARHRRRDLCRKCRSRRQAAQPHEGARRAARQGGRRQAGGRREILRLFRSFRDAGRQCRATGRWPCCAAGTRRC